MRKRNLFVKICALVLCLCMAFCIGGCDFILDDEDFTGGGGNGAGAPSTGGNASELIVDKELENSLALVESLGIDLTERREKYSVDDGDRIKLSREDAIDKVARSSVAIKVSTSDGAGSWGSGTIIDTPTDSKYEFYILTCYHVVDAEGATVTVYLANRNSVYGLESYTFTGKIGGDVEAGHAVSLVGGDKTSDIAVLKLTATTIYQEINDYCTAPVMAPSTLAEDIADGSFGLKKGEEVFAIGNSTGVLPGHVTTGTISFFNRECEVSEVGTMFLLEMDVNSYHGNSGGGLYNLYGELIGIPNCGDDVNMGINYAIPIATTGDAGTDTGFINIAEQLIATRTDYNYGYISGRTVKLGFTVVDSGVDGVLVYDVTAGSLSANAGLKVGDTIVKVHAQETEDEEKTYNVTSLTTLNSALKEIGLLKPFILEVRRVNGPSTIRLLPIQYTQVYFCNTGVYEPPVEEPLEPAA